MNDQYKRKKKKKEEENTSQENIKEDEKAMKRVI